MNYADKEIFDLIEAEKKRQKEGLELIPSENYTSAEVMAACGSILTNKYSEGYPGKRYYGGQENIDQIELLAQKRALALFNLDPNVWHVNVQPYSGSPANSEVYLALADFNDTLMGMNLTMGGHLTHGHKVSFSGKAYNFVQYSVKKETHLIDYDEVSKLALEHKPKIIISGATAYPRVIDFKKFGEIAKEVGAIHMADISHIAGLVAAGVHPSPFEYADVVTTTTHKTLRGPRAAIIFCKKEYAQAIDKAVFPGMQGGPHEHTIAAKAIAFKEAMTPEFKDYGKQIVKNAQALAQELTNLDYSLISGGTDNHLLLIDLTNKDITGQEAQTVLDKVGITLNKNTVPYELRSPFDPSGIRLGTPALTTRGMKESEMAQIAGFINDALSLRNKPEKLGQIRQKVIKLATKFKVPGIE